MIFKKIISNWDPQQYYYHFLVLILRISKICFLWCLFFLQDNFEVTKFVPQRFLARNSKDDLSLWVEKPVFETATSYHSKKALCSKIRKKYIFVLLMVKSLFKEKGIKCFRIWHNYGIWKNHKGLALFSS